MKLQHQELASGRWQKLTFPEQMANIGSEVERTISWKNKNNLEYSHLAFNRALELIDLTLQIPSPLPKRREISRVREALVDYFVADNHFGSTDQLWQKYFSAFTWAAALNSSTPGVE